MDCKISVENKLQCFLEDYQHLAGSRDGYPKIALDIQSVRDLMNSTSRMVERERRNAWADGFESGVRSAEHSDSWSYEEYYKSEGLA